MLSSRSGFIVAPVLYAIGLIGVLGGLFASNIMPSIKLTMQAQNSISDRNAIINAASYFSASSVIGSDGLTFCPPRGAAASSICGSAPVAITDLASVSASDARLPIGYAATASTGSPYEVGIFVAGGSLPQTDAQGHYWIVCRWENQESSPSSPAFAVIGAGANGVIQTKCGDTSTTGDDILQLVTVGVAAQHATAWNNKSNGSTTFGAAGSQVSVDANGNITATSLTTSGEINGGNGNLSTLEVSGLSSLNGGANVGGVFVAEGTANLGITSVASLTASGNIISGGGNLIIGGTTSLQGAYITNIQDSGALTVGGAAFMNTIIATGNASFNALSTVSDATVNGNFTVGGMIKVSDQSLLNGGATITKGLSTDTLAAGTSTLGNTSIGGTLTVTGATNGSNANYTGIVTAASFNGVFSGSYSGSTLTTTGAASVNSLSVSNGATIGGALGVSGFTTLGGLTASGITDLGNLSVAGSTTLVGLSASTGSFSGNLAASSFSLVGDESMYGNLGVGCDANTNVSLSICHSSDNGPIAFFYQSSNYDGVIGIGAPTGYAAYLAFDENNTDYWSIGKAEAQWGRGFYVWDYTNQKDIVYGDYPSGDLYLGESSDKHLTITANGKAGFGAYPVNTLDISGGIAIGTSYAGTITAPTNGLIVQGNIGIGTTSPSGTLDVNGYIHLKKYTSAPTTCSASADGNIALTAIYTICVCKSGTGWVTASTGSTSCTW